MADATPEQPLVLYVDDEPANRVVFSRSFGQRYRIRVASSGEEALTLAAAETPAVVVTDQRMPGMVGTELLTILRDRSPDTIGVVLTAYSDSGPMLEAINKAGASRYIVKPWTPSEVTAVLDGAIASFSLSREVRRLQLQVFDAQRFGSLGVIAASVAHDMSSPLSALVSNMERLGVHAPAVRGLLEQAQKSGVAADEAAIDAADELPDIARESQESAAYLASLVQGMRGQARSSPDQLADPARALAFVVPLVRGVVQERGARLEVERADAPPVQLATTALCQVLVNLVTNAAHALSRELPVRKVTVRVAPEGAGVRFAVIDTGKGMTPEQVLRAGKERFTTKPEGQGTGLGLTIVRDLVERAGGTFQVQSAVGEGTTISFWLPTQAASA